MTEIKEVNERYNILNFVSIGNCIIDESYKVLFWNNYLENSTSVEQKDILGKSLLNFFPDFNKKLIKSRLSNIFKGGPPVILSSQLHPNLFNLQNISENNRIHSTVVTAIPKTQQEGYFALFSVEDITILYNRIQLYRELKDSALIEVEKRKQAEEMLKIQRNDLEQANKALSDKNLKIELQKAELHELNATKDKFFSIVAHDLKNPFSAILGLTDLLIQNQDKYNKDELESYIKDIQESAQTTYNLLENLLTWSLSQSGKIIFKPSGINIKTLVKENIALYQQMAEKKCIKIQSLTHENLFVYADVNMINTVLRNLISNAIKFTPSSGEISIYSRILKNIESKKNIEITVEDTGVGIKQEIIAKLFSIDENHSTTGTNNEKGTGLGLVLCKEFINRNNGEIWIKSKVGKGSKFIFTLPASDENISL